MAKCNHMGPLGPETGCPNAAHAGLVLVLAAMPYQREDTKAIGEVDFFLCPAHVAEFKLEDFLTDLSWSQLLRAFRMAGKMDPKRHLTTFHWRVVP